LPNLFAQHHKKAALSATMTAVKLRSLLTNAMFEMRCSSPVWVLRIML
jgi:hypothetical protein